MATSHPLYMKGSRHIHEMIHAFRHGYDCKVVMDTLDTFSTLINLFFENKFFEVRSF